MYFSCDFVGKYYPESVRFLAIFVIDCHSFSVRIRFNAKQRKILVICDLNDFI